MFEGFETEVSDGPLFSSEDDCRFRESSSLVFVQLVELRRAQVACVDENEK